MYWMQNTMFNGEPSYHCDIFNLRSRLHVCVTQDNCSRIALFLSFYWSKFAFSHLTFPSSFNIKQANWPSAMTVSVFLLFLFSIRYQISDDACVFGVKISIHLQRGYKAWRRGFCSFCILSYNSHTYWKSHNSKLLEACILHRVPRITVINSYLWHFVAKNWLVPGAVFIPKLLCNVT